MTGFDQVWRSLDRQVAEGWAPGIVASIRHGGEASLYATGTLAFGSSEPVRTDTRFRIASLSKLVAGALAATMIAEGLFLPDDPVARWLPELAQPRVLVSPDAPLDQTRAADRPITVRHLLTLTHGVGVSFTPTPLSAPMHQHAVGPIPPQMSADEFMAWIGALPLAYQPGTRWTYHTGAEVLSVFLSRAGGRRLGELLDTRIFGPLGMDSTSFVADPATTPTPYRPTTDVLVEEDTYRDVLSRPPMLESLGGGLVSTVPDYLAFLTALSGDDFLQPDLKARMTSDQLTPAERTGITEMMGPTTSWGWQVGVDTAVSEPWTAPGRYGWTGGSGTSAYVDPSRDLIGVVLSQRFMAGPRENFSWFWEPLAAAIPPASAS